MAQKLWAVRFKAALKVAEGYALALEDMAVAVSWLDADDDGIADVEAIFDVEPARPVVTAALKGAGPLPRFTLKAIPVKNWLAASYRAFPPRRIGRFWVHGGHVTKAPPKGVWPLEIDAATAFGSGEHPTTAGCLRAIGELAKTVSPAKVLDMGCGSGILGVAAVKAWGVPVLAVDNDPESVRVTKAHAKVNGVGRKLKAVVGDGYKTPEVKAGGPYPLVLANILAEPLIKMAPAAAKATAAGGYIVLAGLLTKQAAAVSKAYRAVGFKLVAKEVEGDWPTLVMQKAAA